MSNDLSMDWYYDVGSMEAAYAEAAAQMSMDWYYDAASMEQAWLAHTSLGGAATYTSIAIKQNQDAIDAALREAEKEIEGLEAIIETMKGMVSEVISTPLEWINKNLLGSSNIVLRGLGAVASGIIEGMEWLGEKVFMMINLLADAISDALEVIAEAFGDVFEVILEHIVDYIGVKIEAWLENAVSSPEEVG